MSNKLHHQAPRWITAFTRWYCSSYYENEVLGDMIEAYERRLNKYGRFRASCAYLWDAVRFCRPYIITGPKTQKQHTSSNALDMIKNYFKIGSRSLLHNKVYSAVSITGMAVGISCCLLIALYVQHELSYDDFFEDNENIYRAVLHQESSDILRDYAVTHIMLGPTLEDTYPEVLKSTRVHRLYFHPEMAIMTGVKSFAETKMFLADNQFFEVFPMKFIEGSPVDALATNKHVVLTDKTARRYFGNEPALGKTLKLDFGREIVVSGVIEDLPENSHIDFDLLGSLEFMLYLKNWMDNPNWAVPQVCTYLKLQPGFDYQELESKLPALVESQGREQIDARYGEGLDYTLKLQPLKSIHLHSQLDAEMKANGNVNYVYLLSALAVFILAISCINFINLATAKSSERAREVGIRKVMGSGKKALLFQFMTESVLISLVSLVLALGLVFLGMPAFNQLVNKSFQLQDLLNPLVLLALLLFSVFIGVVSGWYPALVISSMKATSALKGTFKTSKTGVRLRNGLVVFQYFISVSLIAATLIIDQQMSFIHDKRLGFDSEEVMLIKHPLSLGQYDPVEQGDFDRLSLAIIAHSNQKIDVFKKELRNLEGVKEVGGAFQIMGNRFSLSEFQPVGSGEEPFAAHFQTFDNDFISALNIEILEGRGFSDDFNDNTSALINETALRQLGWDDVIGKKFSFKTGDQTVFQIIGVVRDYHYQSLHEEIGSLVIFNGGRADTYFPTALAVKVDGQSLEGVIQRIEAKWNEFVPNEAINLTFLDSDLGQLYAGDRSSKKVFDFFAALAIILACIGLFGLAAYVTQQRTKEIGIRKVLGAKIVSLVYLLSSNFAKLIMIAFLLSVPVTYFGINYWLKNFAYRISVGIYPFLLALVITTLLALLTISHQAVKAALVDPVKSLKTE